MRGDRLVARIGLADEEIGVASDLDQRIRPLRIAGIGDHFALGFNPQSKARTGAFIMQHPRRRDPHMADLVDLADLKFAKRQRIRPVHCLRAGECGFHQGGIT